MLISLNAIKQYIQQPLGVTDTELIDLIGSRLVEVEEVIDLTPKYRNIYIAKVIKAEPIEGTHLNLCEIDAGPRNAEFNQLENGLVQVVCGAPNVHAGMLAVWIAPGAIVPETYGGENFKISTRKLRGYESNGMLAGADELGFDNEHKSIAEIDPKIAQPGDSLADVFGLNDIILDVENKSLTHRPDCFGLIGFAREVAGILGIEFPEPAVFQNIKDCHISSSDSVKISVKIDNSELCPRYSCAVFDLPKNTPSKYLTQDAVFLAKAGMRSIDPMVDLTNIIMLETGQPLHAFDYDKLLQVAGTPPAHIIVRAAEDGEELQLLDGKTIQCIPADILITSSNIPVALAGAMGGKNTEIDASTKRVVLESATFSLYNLRKTQMAHGIFSEAITRFTKGQPAAMTLPVLGETIARLGVEPLAVIDAYPHPLPQTVVKITTSDINNLLGSSYDTATIVKTLENVGFKVEVEDDGRETMLSVVSPLWRTDIHIPEDITEEVGRLLGYDNIPLQLPSGPFQGTEIAPMFALKQRLRNILSDQLAMYELLTYSFISRSLLEKVGQKVADSYEITNSISPELQCFRQQIVPSLLDKVRENIKSGHQDFTIYELNQVARKSLDLDTDGSPRTQTDLGIVCLGDYYQLKADLFATIEHSLKLNLEYRQLVPGSDAAAHYPYLEPVRSAEVFVGGQSVGAFGEVKASVLRKFKLDGVVSACELTLDTLAMLEPDLDVDVRLSRFPSVERDVTFKVAADMPFGRVSDALYQALDSSQLIFQVRPVSIYQPTSESKNLSFHLRFSSPDHTLDSAEINHLMEQIASSLAQIGALVV